SAHGRAVDVARTGHVRERRVRGARPQGGPRAGHRVRGALSSADAAARAYELALGPADPLTGGAAGLRCLVGAASHVSRRAGAAGAVQADGRAGGARLPAAVVAACLRDQVLGTAALLGGGLAFAAVALTRADELTALRRLPGPLRAAGLGRVVGPATASARGT